MKKKNKTKLATIQYKIDAREFSSLREALMHIENKVYGDANSYNADVEVRTIIVWYTLYRKNKTGGKNG